MANIRDLMDGRSISSGSTKDVFNHLKEAADTKSAYDLAKTKMQVKMAPTRKMLEMMDQMHPQTTGVDPNDPFSVNQQGQGGVGQGMNNQDDLARTGQMAKPGAGGGVNNMQPNANPQMGKPGNNGNKPLTPGNGGNKLRSPQSSQQQGKPQQRSASGNKKPGGGATKAVDVEKGHKIKIEVKGEKKRRR